MEITIRNSYISSEYTLDVYPEIDNFRLELTEHKSQKKFVKSNVKFDRCYELLCCNTNNVYISNRVVAVIDTNLFFARKNMIGQFAVQKTYILNICNSLLKFAFSDDVSELATIVNNIDKATEDNLCDVKNVNLFLSNFMKLMTIANKKNRSEFVKIASKFCLNLFEFV